MKHACEWDYYFDNTRKKVMKKVGVIGCDWIKDIVSKLIDRFVQTEEQSVEEDEEEDEEEFDHVLVDETHARSNSFGSVDITQQTNQTEAFNLDLNPDLE